MAVQGSEIIHVADQNRGNGVQTGGFDAFQICFKQQLALLDLLTVLHMCLEALATQTNGFQTHMDQNVGAILGFQADSVAGIEHGTYRGIAGGINLAVGGNDGNALSQETLRKGGIGNFTYGYDLTGQGSENMIGIDFFLFSIFYWNHGNYRVDQWNRVMSIGTVPAPPAPFFRWDGIFSAAFPWKGDWGIGKGQNFTTPVPAVF